MVKGDTETEREGQSQRDSERETEREKRGRRTDTSTGARTTRPPSHSASGKQGSVRERQGEQNVRRVHDALLPTRWLGWGGFRSAADSSKFPWALHSSENQSHCRSALVSFEPQNLLFTTSLSRVFSTVLNKMPDF